jgi:hypothetical protein
METPIPQKNRVTGSYGDKVNAAAGSVFMVNQEREKAAAAPPASPPSDPTRPAITRNQLPTDQAERLGAAVRKMMAYGDYNPFHHTNDQAYEIFRRDSLGYGIDFEVTIHNFRNAVIRSFGMNPGKQERDKEGALFQFTAADARPIISFVDNQESELKKLKDLMAAMKRQHKEQMAAVEEQLRGLAGK